MAHYLDASGLATVWGKIKDRYDTSIVAINATIEEDEKVTAQAIADISTAIQAKADKATTLAGYGITDAQPLISDLSTIRAQAAGAVRYNAAQSLTEDQKAQAKANMGVVDDTSIPSAVIDVVVS